MFQNLRGAILSYFWEAFLLPILNFYILFSIAMHVVLSCLTVYIFVYYKFGSKKVGFFDDVDHACMYTHVKERE